MSLWAVVLTVSYFVILALHLPVTLRFHVYIRSIGLLVTLSSLPMFVWVVRYRKPADILNSTYVTFSKMMTRARLEDRSDRSEPLVVQGPYRYVRHPLYFAVLLLALGLALLFDYTPLFITTILLFLWFSLVVAPFEERELKAIFGQDYEEYARQVPKIMPLPTRFRKIRKDSAGT